METLSLFLALLVGISLTVERVVELIKKAIPRLETPSPNPDRELLRHGFLKLLAVAVGTVAAWQAKVQLASALPGTWIEHLGWVAFIIVGLMSSGGSGFWKQLLGIVRAIKVERAADASARVARAEIEIAEYSLRKLRVETELIEAESHNTRADAELKMLKKMHA
jgi:hypothetical protein